MRSRANKRTNIVRPQFGIFVLGVCLVLAPAYFPILTKSQDLQRIRQIVARAQELSDRDRDDLAYQELTAVLLQLQRREGADSSNIASIELLLGNTAMNLERYREAENHYQAYLKIALRSGDMNKTGTVYYAMARIRSNQRDYEGARKMYEEAVRALESAPVHDRRRIGIMKCNLASTLQSLHEYDDSDWIAQDAIAILRELDERTHHDDVTADLRDCLAVLGHSYIDQKRWNEAERTICEAITISTKLSDSEELYPLWLTADLRTILSGQGRRGEVRAMRRQENRAERKRRYCRGISSDE